jgi:hypothetical protein
VFLINSRLGLVTATPLSFPGVPVHQAGYPFSRSYGVNLPSSLTRVLSIALVSSTHLPVSVCGTGTIPSTLRGFSWQFGLNDSSHPKTTLVPTLPSAPWGISLPRTGLHRDTNHIHWLALIYPPASPHRSEMVVTEYKPFVHRLRLAASA